jgi:predicted nucleic acid-binding Zn ribbon protein
MSPSRRPSQPAPGAAAGPAPLGPTLQRILAHAARAHRGSDHRVHQAWKQALGPELARSARPTGFHRGELRVEVDSSARLQELRSFTGEGFRAAANRILGEESIRKVTYKVAGR